MTTTRFNEIRQMMYDEAVSDWPQDEDPFGIIQEFINDHDEKQQFQKNEVSEKSILEKTKILIVCSINDLIPTLINLNSSDAHYKKGLEAAKAQTSNRFNEEIAKL